MATVPVYAGGARRSLAPTYTPNAPVTTDVATQIVRQLQAQMPRPSRAAPQQMRAPQPSIQRTQAAQPARAVARPTLQLTPEQQLIMQIQENMMGRTPGNGGNRSGGNTPGPNPGFKDNALASGIRSTLAAAGPVLSAASVAVPALRVPSTVVNMLNSAVKVSELDREDTTMKETLQAAGPALGPVLGATPLAAATALAAAGEGDYKTAIDNALKVADPNLAALNSLQATVSKETAGSIVNKLVAPKQPLSGDVPEAPDVPTATAPANPVAGFDPVRAILNYLRGGGGFGSQFSDNDSDPASYSGGDPANDARENAPENNRPDRGGSGSGGDSLGGHNRGAGAMGGYGGGGGAGGPGSQGGF